MPDSQNGARAGGTVRQESGMNAMTLRMGMRRTWMMAGLLASACVMAAGPAVEPGEYVYILGGSASGTIRVKGGSFNITTIGSNCHTCAIEDTFRGGARWRRQG